MNNYIKNNYCMAIFLEYADGESIKENIQYPQFYIEELNIYNVRKYHENLCKNGYLETKDNITYLTEKGKSFINDNKSLVDFFWETSTTVTLKDFVNYVEKNSYGYKMSSKEFYYVMVSILKKKLKQLMHSSENNYEALLNVLLDLAKYNLILGEEKSAYAHYVMALYYQSSGIEYYNEIIKFINGECSYKYLQDVYSNVYINYEIIDNLYKLREQYDEELINDIFIDTDTRINLFSQDEFCELVKTISDGNFALKEFLNVNKNKYKAIIEKAKNY